MLLSNEELVEHCIRLNVPPKGRQLIDALRTSQPERRVGNGHHNVAVRFASRKMGITIQADSHKNELPALYIWEHDKTVYEFYDQAGKVKLCYKNAAAKNVTHFSTPDFFLITKDWIGWIECKTEEWLQNYCEQGGSRFVPDGQGGWRCPPGEAFAQQYGLEFRVRSSKENNWLLVRNLEFLSDYFRMDCSPPPAEEIRKILEQFDGERWVKLVELLNREAANTNVIYKMIADGLLLVDLETELLSEPEFTAVCSDATDFEIYKHQKKSHKKVPSTSIPLVRLSHGAQILWDGKPWKIFNVGANDIFIEDGDRDISNLKIETFHSLVASGAITGIISDRNDHYQLAEKILRQAAEIDIASGIKRLEILDSVARGTLADTISPRTIRYWKANAVHGENAYGNRFYGVIPRISARGNRDRKISQEAIDAMSAVIDQEVLSDKKQNILVCYGFLINRCDEQGIVCPSEKTFRLEIAKRRKCEVIEAREGKKAAYSLTDYYWWIDQSTPRHGERPFEVGHIDHTEADVEVVDTRTGANLGKPWLTVLIDAFTRMVLAFFLSFDPPSYRSCMAVIREAVRRHGRIPKTIVVDRGSDFQSTYFEALLARLECHKKSRPTAKGRFGSVIERFFGMTNQAFFHNLQGNSQALQAPRSMSATHDPRRLAVWTLSALTNKFDEYLNHYHSWRHTTLGVSPEEARLHGLKRSGDRAHVLIPFTQDFHFLCLPSTPAGKSAVRPGKGIKIKGIHYWHPSFKDMRESISVPVLYDPFDVSKAYAMVNREWVLCRSEYQSQLERRTEKEIAIMSQEIMALHIQRSIHRKVKASDIAAFIGTTRESEVLLRQQRKDAERLGNTESIPPTTTINEVRIELPIDRNDPWSTSIFTENFMELK